MDSSSKGVKLLGSWSSPFTTRAKIGLKMKGVEYEFVEENVLSKSDLLLKSNPVYKKIPVLFHGPISLSESLVVLQYIDEAWPGGIGILPSDPYDRAVARFWASYVDDKWFPPARRILQTKGEAKQDIEEAIEGLSLLENAFTGISKGKKFFGGEKIGFLDIVVGSYIGWIEVTEKMVGVKLIDEAKTPNLFKWARVFASDELVKDFLPETDKLVEFAKFIANAFRARDNNGNTD